MPPVPLRLHLLLPLGLGSLALAGCGRLPAPSAMANGEQVYRQQCADCHGPAGQGVEGKYASTLAGDWTRDRLARYIARNMPDDDPETLSAAEAQAVASYIHEAFYSRAAQARLHPARVELSHLTNRQYAIVAADLLRQLEDPSPGMPPPEPARPGLTATYYSSALRGRFDPEKIVHRRTDATLDFTASPGGALRDLVGPADFSAQWRGSFLAEETGDYEFVVRTPNSMRVWINADPSNPAEATLDVNVSTPENPDHRVTVRLLGGRTYPIAIDYWALPEKAGAAPAPAITLRWRPPRGSERTLPARLLSTATTRPTFILATRFPADDGSHGYERGIAISREWEDATTQAAFEIAGHAMKRLDRLARTRADAPDRAGRLEAFAERFATTAFRRPLSPEERLRLITGVFRDSPDPETGVRRVMLLTLKSPHFLYSELPGGGSAATRAAARLAFGLWDSVPDAPLAAAATSGRLRTRAETLAQATRMLDDPRTRAKLREFFHHWLQIRHVEDLGKEPALHPDFSPEIIDDLRASLNLFLDEVVWHGSADYRELLRADYLIANARLARFYGLPPPADEGFARVPAPPGERSGLLTHPYLMAAFSYPKSTSPIHRGVFLTRSIVGRTLKSPPIAVSFNETEFSPGMSMREKVEKLTREETCQGCHATINPLGFSLEWFDTTGRFRREENGRPVNAASDYIDDDERTVRFTTARDVAEFALASPGAHEAFIQQLFQHLLKQPPLAYGPDTLSTLRDSFVASGFNLRTLMVEIVTLGALHGAAAPLLAHTPPAPHAP